MAKINISPKGPIENITDLKYRTIFRLWFPLLFTWLLMAAEGPIITNFISRFPDTKFNLAAYGVTWAIALLIESPVIMLMSASVALIKNKSSYIKLRNFAFSLNIAVTIVMFLLLIPVIYDNVMRLLNLSPDITERTYQGLLAMSLWPAGVGIRRFYQGCLIQKGITLPISIGTIIRITSLFVVLYIGKNFTTLATIVLAGLGHSLSVLAEAFYTIVISRNSINQIKSQDKEPETEPTLSYSGIWAFYFPLAMATLVSLANQPLVTFFMGICVLPLESLAVLPVLNSWIFVFKGICLSLQELVLSLMRTSEFFFKRLKQFVRYLAVVLTFIYGVFAFSPLSQFLLMKVYGLDPGLYEFILPAFKIGIIGPFFYVFSIFYRSQLLSKHKTAVISSATYFEMLAIFAVMLIGTYSHTTPGAVFAMVGIVAARVISVFYLRQKLNALI